MNKQTHTTETSWPVLEPVYEEALEALRIAHDQTRPQQLAVIMAQAGEGDVAAKARSYALAQYKGEGLSEDQAPYTAWPLQEALAAVRSKTGKDKP